MNYQISKRLAQFCIVAGLIVVSCSYRERSQQGQTVVPEIPADISKQDPNVKPSIVVKSAAVYCWWWPESVVSDPQFNADDPPPRTKYVELTEWRYDGERITTAPHKIDFVAQVSNLTSNTFRGTAKFRLYARFEEHIYIADSQTPPTDIEECDDSPWMEESLILDKEIVVESGKESTIEFKEYDLSRLLNQKKGNKALCAFRFVVEIVGASGIVSQKERIISVALGD